MLPLHSAKTILPATKSLLTSGGFQLEMICNEAVFSIMTFSHHRESSHHHHHQVILSGTQDLTMMLTLIVGLVLFDLIVILKSLGEIITNV